MRENDIKKVLGKKNPIILICAILFIVISGLFIYTGFTHLDSDKHPILFDDIISDSSKTKIYSYVEIVSISSFASDDNNTTYFFLVDKNNHFYIASLSQDTFGLILKQSLKEGNNFSYIVKGCSFKINDELKKSAIVGFNNLGLDVTIDNNNFENYFGNLYLDEMYTPDLFQDYFLITIGFIFLIFSLLLITIYFVSLERYNQIIFMVPYDKLFKELSLKGTIYDIINNIAITKKYFIYKKLFKYTDVKSIKSDNYKLYFKVDNKTYKIKYNGDLYKNIINNNKKVIIEK